MMSDDQDRERLGRIARTASYRFYGDTSATADDPWPEEESKEVYEAIAAAVAEDVAGRYRPLVEAARWLVENTQSSHMPGGVMLPAACVGNIIDILAALDPAHAAAAGLATGAGGDDGRD